MRAHFEAFAQTAKYVFQFKLTRVRGVLILFKREGKNSRT